jgi:hypothetical protein
LPKARLLLKRLTVRKSVRDHYIKVIILYPLPEFSVGKFFSGDIAQTRIAMRRASRLAYVYGEGRCSDKYRNNARDQSCPVSRSKHTYRYRGTSPGQPHRGRTRNREFGNAKVTSSFVPLRIPVPRQPDKRSDAGILHRHLQEGFYNARQ